MKKLCCLFVISWLSYCFSGIALTASPLAERPAYLELKLYHFKSSRQEALIDSFLQRQYLPAMHAAGIAAIGVFKPIGNDTAADRRVYVLTPFASLRQQEKVA